MKFLTRILFILLTSHTFIYAQNEYEWISTYDGQGNDYDIGEKVIVDKNDDVYTVGWTTGADDSYDIVTIHYDHNDGTELWSNTFRGSLFGEDRGTDIFVDDSLNSYVVGTVMNDTTGQDFILIKYDNLGNEIWSSSYNYDSNSTDIAHCVVVDQSGNVYVGGHSRGDTSVMIVLKYNNLGDTLWSYKIPGPAVGVWDETIKLQIIDDDLFVGASSGNHVHIARLDKSTGSEFWNQFHNQSGIDNFYTRILDMVVDPDKNLTFTGDYVDSIGSLSPVNNHSLTAQYDSNGILQWTNSYYADIDYTSTGEDVDLDGNGNIYVCGRADFPGDEGYNYFTIKYNESGIEQWHDIYNGNYVDMNGNSGNDYALHIKVKGGDIFVLGRATNVINGEQIVGITTLKFDLDGNKTWTSPIPISSAASNIAVDSKGNAYVTGMHRGATSSLTNLITLKFGQLTDIATLESNKLTVFPNPTKETLYIKNLAPGFTELFIYDVVGRQVSTKRITNNLKTSISVSDLKEGFYTLKLLNSTTKVHTFQFLKQ